MIITENPLNVLVMKKLLINMSFFRCNGVQITRPIMDKNQRNKINYQTIQFK